jgi:hypothetical protein
MKPRGAVAFRVAVHKGVGKPPMPPEFIIMLPVNALRQIAALYPTRAAALDHWQRQFVADQLARFEKWGDDIRLSEKQGLALEKALAAMQKQGGEQA